MENYTQLIKDVARVISDLERENYLLTHELAKTKELLKRAEDKIAAVEDGIDRMISGASKEGADA